MVAVEMLRYLTTNTKKLSEEQLHLVKLRSDFVSNKIKEKNGFSDYVSIVEMETMKVIA